MKCKVKRIKKNLRYRILTINDENYILDMGQSFWRFLIPAFAWIFPHTVYKVNREETLEKIEAPTNPEEAKQKNIGELSLLGGAICIPLGSLVYSLLDKSLSSTSLYINIIIVTIAYLSIVFFVIYMNIRFKKSLRRVINLSDYPTEQLWIRPQSLKYMLIITFYFLFFLIPSIVMFVMYIQQPNILPLIVGTLLFSLVAVYCFIPINRGDYIVKFENQRIEE